MATPDDARVDDADLVARAQVGDRDAQDELCRRHLPAVQAWVRLHRGARLAQREGLSDLVQTVFRGALQDLRRFEYRGPNSLRNWLLTYADHKLGNRAQLFAAQRRNTDREAEAAALSQLYASIATPSQAVAHSEDIARFERAFGRLPEADRQIILLARIEELPHAVVAERLGISEAASKQALSRARKRLALELAR